MQTPIVARPVRIADAHLEVGGMPGEAARSRPIALIVDTERSIRTLARAALELRGYDVLESAHPHDAIVVFHATPGISAVVVDLRLPELDGRSLITHLRRRRPLLPVLLLADRPSEVRELTVAGDGAATMVMLKPLTPMRLADALADLLPATA